MATRPSTRPSRQKQSARVPRTGAAATTATATAVRSKQRAYNEDSIVHMEGLDG